MPGKRKRRIPKHLTDSYYVPKKTMFMTNFEVGDSSQSQTPSSSLYKHKDRRRRKKVLVDKTDCNFKCDKCRARYSLFCICLCKCYHENRYFSYVKLYVICLTFHTEKVASRDSIYSQNIGRRYTY